MDLRLRQGDRDAQHPATLVRADADRREHGGVTDDPAVAHLLVTGVEDQISDLAERPAAPGLQFVVEQLCRAADLRRRQALDAEPAHHRLDLAGRDALDVHLGHRQHHGAHRPAAALQRLGVERRAIMAGGLGNVDGDRARRRVDALGLVAVGIALALGGALIKAGAAETAPARSASPARTPGEKTVAISPGPCSIRCSKTASTAVSFCLSIRVSPWVVLQLHGIPEWNAPAGARPGRGSRHQRKRISRPQVTVPGTFLMRQRPYLRQQFRRGNAAYHPDCRATICFASCPAPLLWSGFRQPVEEKQGATSVQPSRPWRRLSRGSSRDGGTPPPEARPGLRRRATPQRAGGWRSSASGSCPRPPPGQRAAALQLVDLRV